MGGWEKCKTGGKMLEDNLGMEFKEKQIESAKTPREEYIWWS